MIRDIAPAENFQTADDNQLEEVMITLRKCQADLAARDELLAARDNQLETLLHENSTLQDAINAQSKVLTNYKQRFVQIVGAIGNLQLNENR